MTDSTPDRSGRDPHAADDLRGLLADAASGIDPHDRLHELRRRTRESAGSGGPQRSGRARLAVIGAGLATAAAVVAGLVIGDLGSENRPDPAGTASAGAGSTAAADGGEPTALYFLGDTATGARLFREFSPVVASGGSDAVLAALRALAADTGPTDPDYRTTWPASAFEDALVTDEVIRVDIAAVARDRAQDISAGEAALGLQQVVYTAEAVVGSALPVEFHTDGAPADQVLGVRMDGAVERDRQFTTTAPVNVSDPAEGQVVRGSSGERLEARGTMSVNVGAVRWTLSDDTGAQVAAGEARILRAGTGGTTANALGWETEALDVSALPPGTYVFTARVREIGQTSDDPTRTFVDDRTVVVE